MHAVRAARERDVLVAVDGKSNRRPHAVVQPGRQFHEHVSLVRRPGDEAAIRRDTSHSGSVRLCYDAIVRTTLDISDEAYYIAKAIARDQNRSLGRVVGDLILRSANGAKGASLKMSDYGFPTFRCVRPVTTEDVRALDDDE